MNEFTLGKDSNNITDYSIRFAESSYAVVLAANVNVTVTVPVGAKKAAFSCTGDAYFVGIREGAVAITPPAGAVATIAGELAPAVRDVSYLGGKQLNILSTTAETFNVTFYS